jgi:hypothetical protein
VNRGIDHARFAVGLHPRAGDDATDTALKMLPQVARRDGAGLEFLRAFGIESI